MTIQELCYHEAGHMLVAYCLEDRILKIDIHKDDDEIKPIGIVLTAGVKKWNKSNGKWGLSCIDSFYFDLDSKKEVDNYLLFHFAGNIAVQLWTWNMLSGDFSDDTGNDRIKIERVLFALGPGINIKNYNADLLAKSKAILIKHWKVVRALVKELLLHYKKNRKSVIIEGYEAQRFVEDIFTNNKSRFY